MDLRLVDTKISERRFQRLLDFVAELTKIFNNYRYYNAKESNIARCTTTLSKPSSSRASKFSALQWERVDII